MQHSSYRQAILNHIADGNRHEGVSFETLFLRVPTEPEADDLVIAADQLSKDGVIRYDLCSDIPSDPVLMDLELTRTGRKMLNLAF